MSLWPFVMGRFLELPYTLAQDSTLTDVVGERSPRLWLEKLDCLARFFGMALVNTHPDYLRNSAHMCIYRELLENVRERSGCWTALPREVARWWRLRASAGRTVVPPGAVEGIVHREEGSRVTITHASSSADVPGTVVAGRPDVGTTGS